MARKIIETLSSVDRLMQEWDWERNTLDPSLLGSQSNQRAWWKCKYGHSWEAKINNRYNGRGCPICRYRLKTSFPEQAVFFYVKAIYADAVNGYTEIFKNTMEIAKQWDYDKNGSLTPTQVFPSSNKKVWWKCDKGHTWKTAPNSRARGTNCPYCAGNNIWVGFNDLATTHSEISAEWNYDKNGDLTPQNVSAGSGKKVWWKCQKCGNEYQSIISNRVKGYGCKCSGKWAQKRNKQ